MKLTTETISVLKNFSTINNNLRVKAGSSLKTMSAAKNIVAKAEITEKFPNDFEHNNLKMSAVVQLSLLAR